MRTELLCTGDESKKFSRCHCGPRLESSDGKPTGRDRARLVEDKRVDPAGKFKVRNVFDEDLDLNIRAVSGADRGRRENQQADPCEGPEVGAANSAGIQAGNRVYSHACFHGGRQTEEKLGVSVVHDDAGPEETAILRRYHRDRFVRVGADDRITQPDPWPGSLGCGFKLVTEPTMGPERNDHSTFAP